MRALLRQFLGQSRPPVIVSLDPDAVSNFGHYVRYDKLLERAVQQRRGKLKILGPQNAAPELFASNLHRTFSVTSRHLQCTPEPPSKGCVATFETELRAGVSELRRSWRGSLLLFMYCGSPAAAEAVARVIAEDQSLSAVINLFYLSHVDFGHRAYRRQWSKRFRTLKSVPRLTLMAPTEELSNEFFIHYGIELEVLPSPSTTFFDTDVATKSSSLSSKVVVFPGNMNTGKGTKAALDSVSELRRLFGERHPDPVQGQRQQADQFQR